MGRRRGLVRIAVVVSALCLLTASSALGIAAAGGDRGTADRGAPELTVEARFGPGVGPAPRQTPIRLEATAKIADPGAFEKHPPALRELQIESADLEIHTGGIPICRLGQLQATEARVALKECGSALIGSGTALAQVAFAEQKPIDVKARLLVFNGGNRDGKTTLFVHTYFPNPISGAIVTTVTASSLKGGHFGTFAVAKVPQITGGSGSIIGFHLTIDRKVTHANPISATCEGGHVSVYLLGKFEDGSRATDEVVRPCRR